MKKWITYIDEPNEIFGWLGTIMILLAYALLTSNSIQASSIPYQAMNCLGALSIIYNTYKKKAFPPMALNIIWMLIALYGIYTAL